MADISKTASTVEPSAKLKAKKANHRELELARLEELFTGAPAEPLDVESMLVDGAHINVTPRIAHYILQNMWFEGQNARLKQGEVNEHVRFLEVAMVKGALRSGRHVHFARIRGGNLFLVDGYHRLTALRRTGQSLEFRIAIDVVDSQDSVSLMFHTFNRLEKVRSDAQVLDALDVAKQHGISEGATSACWAAIPFLNNGLRSPRGSKLTTELRADNKLISRRANLAEPWWPVARRLEEALAPAHPKFRKKIYAGSRFAVALVTMRWQPDKAWEFWHGVARNHQLDDNDPRNAFRQDVQLRVIPSGDSDTPVSQSIIPWNRFYLGKTLKKYSIPKTLDSVVYGAPATVWYRD